MNGKQTGFAECSGFEGCREREEGIRLGLLLLCPSHHPVPLFQAPFIKYLLFYYLLELWFTTEESSDRCGNEK